MHKLLLLAALLVAGVSPLGAQRDTTRRDTSETPFSLDVHELPREIVRHVVDVYNAPQTLRVRGSLTIDSSRVVTGDVAMLRGTLTIAGRVTGRVVAINGDLALRPGARVDGDITVVGGRVTGLDVAQLGGEVRVHQQVLGVREEGDRITTERDPTMERWWDRLRSRHMGNHSGLRLASGATYNRVEGLPIYFGPTLRQQFRWGRAAVDVFGVFRTAREFRWDPQNIGHNVRGELQLGSARALVLGARLYDLVTPVEDWQITDTENGLSSFFLHRDFRDHFDRHGATGYARLIGGKDVDFALSLSDQRWGSRGVRDPWTLFRDGEGWRANPLLDEGRFQVATATAHLDTRNDVDNPWAGWYLTADLERGAGRLTGIAPSTDPEHVYDDRRITYYRGFIDMRRYNRIAPNAQVNLRLVLGGTLGGDPLPLERRLSVGGPGTLPGYDFRRGVTGTDVLQCSQGTTIPAGRPAECERVALAQIEYREDLNLDFGLGEGSRRFLGLHARGAWVVFANSGRGWLVGEPRGTLQYRSGALPAPSTFKTDVGVGIDFAPVGLFVAKAVSDSKAPANFIVRVRRRI